MPRFFAIDTSNNNEMLYIGAVDKNTNEWTECNEELLKRVNRSILEKAGRKVNEILNRDPTVPFAYKGEAQVKTI